MQAHAREALAASRAYRSIVENRLDTSSWPRRRWEFDLVEVFGGTSMVSIRAACHWNMRVLQPIDLQHGIDLREPRQQRWLLSALARWKPRLVVVGFPCTSFSILQRNVNYKDRPGELRERQDRDTPFLRLTRAIFEGQLRRRAHCIVENPVASDAWKEPDIAKIREKKQTCEVTASLCMFDMRGGQVNTKES